MIHSLLIAARGEGTASPQMDNKFTLEGEVHGKAYIGTVIDHDCKNPTVRKEPVEYSSASLCLEQCFGLYSPGPLNWWKCEVGRQNNYVLCGVAHCMNEAQRGTYIEIYKKRKDLVFVTGMCLEHSRGEGKSHNLKYTAFPTCCRCTQEKILEERKRKLLPSTPSSLPKATNVTFWLD